MPPKEITRTQPTMDATPAGQIHQPFVQPARAADFEVGQASGGEQRRGKPLPAWPGTSKEADSNSEDCGRFEFESQRTRTNKRPTNPSAVPGQKNGTLPGVREIITIDRYPALGGPACQRERPPLPERYRGPATQREWEIATRRYRETRYPA
jgi:hypothetical protein